MFQTLDPSGINVYSDLAHIERAAAALGYDRCSHSVLQCFSGAQQPAFIHEDGNMHFIFEVQNSEYDDQSVFSMHLSFNDHFDSVEIKWIGLKALLAFALKDVFKNIVCNCLVTLNSDVVNSTKLFALIKDIDHTFVTPDFYIAHD